MSRHNFGDPKASNEGRPEGAEVIRHPSAAASPAVPGTESSKTSLFCPVARALDLIGERWTLVIVRHLLGAPRGFQELRMRSGVGPRVLSTRLRQLVARGLVETVSEGKRSLYGLTENGRALEPVVREIARWWVREQMAEAGPFAFSETSAASVIEALPFMLREDRAKDARVTYEIRLTGTGGGVWTVTIADGRCQVHEGFAEHADVRYTADALEWCRLAMGFRSDREAFDVGTLTKDGTGGSIAWYFHNPRRSRRERGDER